MKTSYTRFLLPLVFFIVIAYFFMRGLSLDPRYLPSSLINKPAPAFRLASLSEPNKFYSSQEVFAHHTTLMTVWASWCEACRTEQPYLMTLQKKYPQLQFVGLNYKDKTEAAKNWLAMLGNPFTLVLLDSDGQTAINYGVYGTPESYLINDQGIVLVKHVGVLDEESWQKEFVQRLE